MCCSCEPVRKEAGTSQSPFCALVPGVGAGSQTFLWNVWGMNESTLRKRPEESGTVEQGQGRCTLSRAQILLPMRQHLLLVPIVHTGQPPPLPLPVPATRLENLSLEFKGTAISFEVPMSSHFILHV